MGDLYLNALPLSVAAGSTTKVGRFWARDNDVDALLRGDSALGVEFNFRSQNRDTFAWALPGGALPPEAAGRGAEVSLEALPAFVLAAAARDGAVRRLQAEGLELRSDRIGQPAQLSRRKNNLAAKAVASLPAGVGAYTAIAVQGLPLLGDGSAPGEVALIVDQSVEHVMDVPLADLARAGVDLVNVRMHWQHRPGCTCASPEAGDAGRYLGGDPTGTVQLRDGAGHQRALPAACLAVQANRWMMARYLASLNGRGERDIAEALKQAADQFGDTPKRWQHLEQTVPWLGKLELFDGVTASLRTPLLVPSKSNLAGQRGPVALPSVPEGNLNFHYGAPELHDNAAVGLGRHGPYDEGQSRTDILRAVVVGPEAFAGEARKLQSILTSGLARFKGIKQRYHLRDFEATLHLFPDATRAGYEHAVATASKSGADIVFFVTKREFRYAPRGENPYLAAKAVLASSGIASQAVTIETLNQPDHMLQWSSDSVALAAYTKVGNIPYVLHDPDGGRELVLGVGRADVYDPAKRGRRQRFGASVAVRQDGDFLFAGSTTPVSTDEDYETHLARLLKENIARYAAEQGAEPDRLVIYLFKRTGRRELYAIKKAIGDRDIKFALLHVNRDSPLWLVERNGSRIAAPQRGTTVALSITDRLLITGDPKKPAGAHPLRLTLDNKSTYRDMNRLVRQAYGFTKTSYRGFLQSNEPSPILFGRLLAQKVEQLVPYGFNPASAAGPLGDKPWFL
jgi:hypothetical protein